jgi:ketosteroid isomerase-like protein
LSPTESANIALAQKLYTAIGRADFETVKSILSPDVIVREAAGLPYGGDYSGHDGFLDLMRHLDECWEDLGPFDMKYAAGGDMVVMLCTLKGISRATGRQLCQPLAEAWTFRDHRAIEGTVLYQDTYAVRQICGLP